MANDPKHEAKKGEAFPSVAKAKDDAAAKAIQSEARAKIDAAEANPDAAAAAENAPKPTGKKYRVMDGILEVKIGSQIPDAHSTRAQGAAVWSSEFDPKSLEARYLAAGAIEEWKDD